ncbi:MAG TPA: hypothetical protein VNX29_18675 [Kaistia sp.]|nr:hypothetical protein [Kaistia sp.]
MNDLSPIDAVGGIVLPATEAAAMHAARLAAQATVTVDQLATEVGAAIFDLGGASTTKRTHNLDRHWRNARTLASHNPSLYKARAIGDLILNGTALPTSGFF